ncbi:asparagine synthetase B family protein [Sphingomonas psychrotolerans]|nr:asparagine synthase-related protein [Sphingomonas psychrotolerans]
MTALAGVWNFTGEPSAGAAARRMLAAQRIYGPHGDAAWDGGDVAIGRAIYEILPEDVHDRGPIIGGGGRFRLVADVRLDNRDELGAALCIDVDEARTLPDAAIVMRAWERWEMDSFARLYGDYAFALWDEAEHRLVLARDHVGARPLHYHRNASFLAFASMPKGLHALPEIPYAPDEIRAAEFLALMAERGPRSFFAKVSRVEAGQCAVIGRAGITRIWHWHPPTRTPMPVRGTDYAEGLRAHLDAAVAARLRGAGARVGSHLSAGFDSGSVCATAARLMSANGRVVAFTAVPRPGFTGAAGPFRINDEGDLAAATAAKYPNIEHVRVHSSGASALTDLDRDYFLFERPLANADVQQRWNQINAEARDRGIRVMLTAQSGNATISFSGLSYLPELVRRGRLPELLRVAGALVRNRDLRWRGALLQALGPWIPQSLWVLLHEIRSGYRPALSTYSMLKPGRLEAALQADESGDHSDFDPSYRPRSDATDLQRWMLSRVDFGNNQKGVLAGWGVDLRDPTADRRLAEYCMSIPLAAILDQGRLRGLARTAFADLLPPSVLDERRKGHQAADWFESFASQRDHVCGEIDRLAQVGAATAALDMERMRRLAEDWPVGGWTTPGIEARYRHALLRGMVSGHFLRKSSRSNV